MSRSSAVLPWGASIGHLRVTDENGGGDASRRHEADRILQWSNRQDRKCMDGRAPCTGQRAISSRLAEWRCGQVWPSGSNMRRPSPNTKTTVRMVVDASGHTVKNTPAASGGHVTWHHNRMVDTLVEILASEGIDCTGGTGNPVLNFFSAEQEMRPDIYTDASAFKFAPSVAPTPTPLPTLFDVKTLSVGQVYKQGASPKTMNMFPSYQRFNSAVNTRQRQVGQEYFKKAEKMDEKKSNSHASDQLREYGKDGLVIGLVFGGFFEVSQGVHELLDLASRASATKILKYAPDTSPCLLLARCRRRLNEKVAIASVRSWHTLLRDRLRHFFGKTVLRSTA